MSDHNEAYSRSRPEADSDDVALDLPAMDSDEALLEEQARSLDSQKTAGRLTALAGLASVAIETSLVSDLSGTLHSLFDPVCEKTLPIYFGPLLGRLYLEGL